MARSRGSAAPARKAAAPQRAAAPPPPPAPMHHAPPPAPMQGGGMGSGIMGTIAQGMALGAGSEVGHMAVRSMLGSGSSGHQEAAPAPQAAPQAAPSYNQSYGGSQSFGGAAACQLPQQELYKCLKEQNGNASACQFYFDALKQCQEGSM